MTKKLILASVTSLMILSLILATPINAQIEPITPQGNKAKQKAIESLSNALENHYENLGVMNISRVNDTDNVITVYNNTGISLPPPPPPPPACIPGTHLENGVCVPDPKPTSGFVNLIFVGDVIDSTAGKADYNIIKSKNPTTVFVAGDLGYGSSLSWFKSTYGTFKSKFLDPTGKLRCVVGNHDAPEDGSASIYAEAKAYCGSYWRNTISSAKTVVFGFNTNGDLSTTGSQYNGIVKSLTNSTYMADKKNVVFLSHKQCYTPPEAHHPVESKVKDFCNALAAKVPAGVKVYYIAGHDHIMAQSTDGLKFVNGAGGKSHYDCPTSASSAWSYCNETAFGYLALKIDKATGEITPHFYNTLGGQIH